MFLPNREETKTISNKLKHERKTKNKNIASKIYCTGKTYTYHHHLQQVEYTFSHPFFEVESKTAITV